MIPADVETALPIGLLQSQLASGQVFVTLARAH